MAKELDALGMLTNLDKAVFASYCQAYSMWASATIKLQEQGMIFKTPGKTRTFKDGSVEQSGGGYPMVNPWWNVINKENEKMMKALVEMGMSPSSRSRVKVPEKPKKDAAEDFLNEGMGEK
jgi:P27 family predicted phage terminase small subunit